MTSSFLSHARRDDVDPFDPATFFVARLPRDLAACGFEVWFDRVAMPSRGLTVHREIQGAVAARERLVLVDGPRAAVSRYAVCTGGAAVAPRVPGKAVTPIQRLSAAAIWAAMSNFT